MTEDIDDSHMDEDIKLEDDFCAQYLGNKRLFPEIKEETIKTLFDNGFDCLPTLLAMDFEEDLPLVCGINLGQKALVRQAITLLHKDYHKHISHRRLMVTGQDMEQLFARIEKAISDQQIDYRSPEMKHRSPTNSIDMDLMNNNRFDDFTRLKHSSEQRDEEMSEENDRNGLSDHDLRQESDSDSHSNTGRTDESNRKSSIDSMTEEEYDYLKRKALDQDLRVKVERLEKGGD